MIKGPFIVLICEHCQYEQTFEADPDREYFWVNFWESVRNKGWVVDDGNEFCCKDHQEQFYKGILGNHYHNFEKNKNRVAA